MPNVASLLARSARRHGGRVALRYGTRHLTYRELADAAMRFAAGLTERGARPCDRVAIFAKNCPEYVIALFGTFAAGMTAVPINAKLAAPELAVILEDSAPRVVVHDAGRRPVVEMATSASQALLVEIGTQFDHFLGDADSIEFVPADVASDSVAWLFYTSGTTGRPKGAELTHRNLTAMTWLELADVCDYRPEDVVLHVAPLSHGGGLYLLSSLARSAENVIHHAAAFDAAEVLRLIEGERVTVIAFLAPTMIVMLLDADADRRADTSSLRRAVYGGAPIHLEHARRMVERFGHIFVQIYGQGESPMTATYLDLGDTDIDDDLLVSAGWPHPGVEVAVLGVDDEPLPEGAAGEICIRGDTVMRGYRNNQEATAAALRSDWLHTGDIGVLDATGRLTLLDRSKDVIISGGTNIYPREVEDALLGHDAVEEVVVFGAPDDLWGERVVAAVVPREGDATTAEELIDWCRSRIASFKKPKRVVFVDTLPKNAYGKVLRREVRDRLADRVD